MCFDMPDADDWVWQSFILAWNFSETECHDFGEFCKTNIKMNDLNRLEGTSKRSFVPCHHWGHSPFDFVSHCKFESDEIYMLKKNFGKRANTFIWKTYKSLNQNWPHDEINGQPAIEAMDTSISTTQFWINNKKQKNTTNKIKRIDSICATWAIVFIHSPIFCKVIKQKCLMNKHNTMITYEMRFHFIIFVEPQVNCSAKKTCWFAF